MIKNENGSIHTCSNCGTVEGMVADLTVCEVCFVAMEEQYFYEQRASLILHDAHVQDFESFPEGLIG